MKKIPFYCDSKSVIKICHNLVQHLKPKHITLWNHFIKDHVKYGNVKVDFVHSTNHMEDIFTKALPQTTFNLILQGVGMIKIESVSKSSLKIMSYEMLLFICEQFQSS